MDYEVIPSLSTRWAGMVWSLVSSLQDNCRKLLGPMCWETLKELQFLSKVCTPCIWAMFFVPQDFSSRSIGVLLVPTDSAMNFNQPLLGLCIVLTGNLLGCEDGAVYSSLSDAVSALCDGSSCPASCKCCLEKQYARADECISAFVWYGWGNYDRMWGCDRKPQMVVSRGILQNYPISIHFKELETVQIPSKTAFHPDMVPFWQFPLTLVFSPDAKLNVVVCFPLRGWKL